MLIRYYLSLRMGAALAFPDIPSTEIPTPTPIVREFPSRLQDGFDARELVRVGGHDLVVLQDSEPVATGDFVWN